MLLAVNHLMELSLELVETRSRRAGVAASLERLKQQLAFLRRPSYASQRLAEAFSLETQENYRKTLAQAMVRETIFKKTSDLLYPTNKEGLNEFLKMYRYSIVTELHVFVTCLFFL
jgi:hypothetical protein